ncbi:MAG: phosphoribosylamine--glycine ligase [Deltaproteobacteria bacterium]|nr:phosphoribosylamine--glycine ligase [Deltaproteobacteria bacterium]
MLVVGGGAREHAIAWKLAQSPRVGRVVVCPGNAGIARLAETVTGCVIAQASGVPLAPAALVALARAEGVALTVVGPEAVLAAGLTDALADAGIPCFGPTRAAAEIETSKAFAKAFMARHGIPTARFATFTDLAAAELWIRHAKFRLVVKASGLAAGKGVLVCENDAQALGAVRAMLTEGAFGDAGREVVVEERLVGEELSVMAFADGERFVLMPAVQDHKAVFDGDAGPNTGGMGAYTPVPAATPGVLAEVSQRVIGPALRGLAEEGRPFRGVLYAGVMLTAEGLRVLEFNARFGDPETEVVLPLLDGDLYDIARSCVAGALDPAQVRFRAQAAATVVVASGGYPGEHAVGKPIAGLAAAEARALVFHAGTRREGERVVTAGGRVLAVTGVADGLEDALQQAYGGVAVVAFDAMHIRHDIGQRGVSAMSYGDAGVSIDAGAEAVERMKAAVKATYTPHVLAGIGAFGGLFDAAAFAGLERPVLVASTDGVGTKTLLATKVGRVRGLGADLVNHCVNDILVQGARPLFFLDYVASAKLDPAEVADVVGGMADACRENGCVLLGGETAEMPGVYRDRAIDVAGTIVGVVERGRIIDGSGIRAGDVVLALRSSGLHTNGYSLARRVLERDDLLAWEPPGFDGKTVADALLAVHRSYLPDLEALWRAGVQPRGLVHVTGGGLVENPPRILPDGVAMRIDCASWEVPPLFRLIQARGRVPDAEMRRVFNLGLGMLVVVAEADAERARAAVPELLTVGGIVPRGAAPVELV